MRCVGCGTELRAAARFCDACGRPVAEARDLRSYTPSHMAEKILAGARAHEGEHKQVTVLFADVKGSMDLSERLDSETWHGIMDRFFTILCEGVQRYEGTVSKFTGDGIMALFGAPIAHEDHARRACHAALHLTGELEGYAAELRDREGVQFAVRIGVNSGEVLLGSIGEDLHVDYTAVGHSVGLAQRMEQLAEPGKAYLTEHTAALVSGYFQLLDHGKVAVKGVHEPLTVYELESTGAARTALDVARARGLSRFVGREDALGSLGAALDCALGGDGRVVGVVADPGVGKSRLGFEFGERCRARGIPVFEAHALAHARTVPFVPVLELLRACLSVHEEDQPKVARARTEDALLSLDASFRDDLPLVFDFLGVPDPEHPLPHMDAEGRLQRLLAFVGRLVRAQGSRGPAVCLVEDLHWIDRASEAFLKALVEAAAGTRVLLIATFRPEYGADWMEEPHYVQLPLSPLDPEATDELLHDLLGAHPSVDGLADLIRERTGGNAFFIEEVVQGLAESGQLEGRRGRYRLGRSIEEIAVPPTVQAMLASRIDRLGERTKAVLQTAAVVGKRFAAPVLRAVTGLPARELDGALRELVEAEFLHGELGPSDAELTFKHPLTQEVAYGSLLSERRASVHAEVARAVEELSPDRLDELAALIAHHWDVAGDALQAARWSRRAAEWAGVNDPAEAMRNWRKVAALADRAEESPETIELGLTARIWTLELGWRVGIPEAEATEVLAQGRAIAERVGDEAALAMMLLPYAVGLASEGKQDEFVKLSLEARRLADESGDRGARLVARSGLVYALLLSGRARQGLEVAEEGVEITGGDPTVSIGMDIPCALAFFIGARGWFLSFTGQLSEAATEMDRALKLAEEQHDTEVVSWASNFRTWLARYSGNAETALAHANRSVEIAERIGGPYHQVWAYGSLALAQLMCGAATEAAAAAQRAVAVAVERGAALEFVPISLAALADARLANGDAVGARQAAEQAVAHVREGQLRMYEPCAQVALARVLLRGGLDESDAIEAALQRALALVEETGARSEEPFIRVELAELARLRGDEDGRLRELSEAQRLFTEFGATGHLARIAAELGAGVPAAGD